MELFAIVFLVAQGLLAIYVLVLNRAATRNWQASAGQRIRAGTLATALVREEQSEHSYHEDRPFRKAA